MGKSAARLPKFIPPVGANDEQVKAILTLCARSRCFWWVTALLANNFGRRTGCRRRFQPFRLWSSRFSAELLKPENESQRETFIELTKCTRRRSGAILIVLFLSGQLAKIEKYSDTYYQIEADAAKELARLIDSFGRRTAPHLVVLKKGFGMWPCMADEIDSSIQAITRAVREPWQKSDHNQIIRSLNQTLNRWTVYLCRAAGLKGEPGEGRQRDLNPAGRAPGAIGANSVPDPMRGYFWRAVSILLGRGPGISNENARGLFQIAQWAAGKWMTTDTSKQLYYDQVKPASEAIREHVDEHIGSRAIS